MKDEEKTKAQLLDELTEMRRRMAKLQEAKEAADATNTSMFDLWTNVVHKLRIPAATISGYVELYELG